MRIEGRERKGRWGIVVGSEEGKSERKKVVATNMEFWDKGIK